MTTAQRDLAGELNAWRDEHSRAWKPEISDVLVDERSGLLDLWDTPEGRTKLDIEGRRGLDVSARLR